MTEKLLVGLLVLLFLLTGVTYSLVVPPFETPDELYHYAFARHLAQGNALPVQAAEPTGPWEQEGSQAPLYYLILGVLMRGIDQSDFDRVVAINPHANLGDPLYPGNKNFMLYSAQRHPLTGVVLAMHVGRWFSLLLGAFTVLCTYGLARLAFPRSRLQRLLATGLAATVPQFVFMSASVSNDNAINAASAAVLLYSSVLVARRRDQEIAWWEWGGLGVLLGLAALSKLQGLGLIALVGLMAPVMAWDRKEWTLALRAVPLLVLPVLVIAGWWYARNLMLYGDLFGVQNLLSINGMRDRALSWIDLRGELRGLRMSFWGLFGWFSILLPHWYYVALDGLTLGAGIGAVMVYVRSLHTAGATRLLHRPQARVHLVILLWSGMSLGLIGYWISIAEGAQGRLLFPALGALAVLLTVGVTFWLDFLGRRTQVVLAASLPVGLWLCSLYALTVVLPGAYGVPQTGRVVAAPPAAAVPVGKVYGDGLELVAAQIPEGRFRPGDEVSITLYMRARVAQTQDHELFIQLLDNNNIQIGNVTTHPGWGTLPLTLWRPGLLYADEYRVRIAEAIDPRSPLLARVYVGFIDPDSTAPESEGLLPVQGGGPKIESRTIGYVEIEAEQTAALRPLDMRPMQANLGNVIGLTGYRYPAQVQSGRARELAVTLFWEASHAPDADYTAFVHLSGPDGTFVAAYDQPPAEGRFPTSRWRPGDASLSKFPIVLPPNLAPGDYQLWAGLYRSDSAGLERLPVLEADRPVQDNRILLGTVQVRP